MPLYCRTKYKYIFRIILLSIAICLGYNFTVSSRLIWRRARTASTGVTVFEGERISTNDSSFLVTTGNSMISRSPSAVMMTVPTSPKSKSNPKAKKKQKPPKNKMGRVPLKSFTQINMTSDPDVTIVTAFFDLGKIRKGKKSSIEPSKYFQWAAVYEYLQNPLVVYTESDSFAENMTDMRSALANRTHIIKIERNSTWGFNYIERIRKIYSSKEYPKYYPNTVIPEYTCSQHAKYACVEDAITRNIFNTTYIAWLDIGYFRYITKRKKKFVIVPPKNFDKKKVALNTILPKMKTKATPEEIFRTNAVWVGGGMFFGQTNVVKAFIADYKVAVERYLNQSLSDSDQQVLYAMNTDSEKKILKSKVELQIYKWEGKEDRWFYLGYSCYRELWPGS